MVHLQGGVNVAGGGEISRSEGENDRWLWRVRIFLNYTQNNEF